MECAKREPHGRGKRLITDEQLRTDLELCDRWGIPHSQFLGIGDGRWSERDRDKARAFREYQRTVCPQCGTRYDDWDHGGPDEEDAYVASVQLCVGCQVIGEKQDAVREDGSPHGKKIALIPVSVHAALQTERDLKEKQLRERRQRRKRDDSDD